MIGVYRSRSRITPEDPCENDLSSRGRKKEKEKGRGKKKKVGNRMVNGPGKLARFGRENDQRDEIVWAQDFWFAEGRIGAVTCKFHALRLVVVDPPPSPPPLFPNSILDFSVSSGIKSASVSKKMGPDSAPEHEWIIFKRFDQKIYSSKEGREGGKKNGEGKCIKKKKSDEKEKGTCNCVWVIMRDR